MFEHVVIYGYGGVTVNGDTAVTATARETLGVPGAVLVPQAHTPRQGSASSLPCERADKLGEGSDSAFTYIVRWRNLPVKVSQHGFSQASELGKGETCCCCNNSAPI